MFKFYNGALVMGNLRVQSAVNGAQINGAKYYEKYVITKNVNSPTLLVESI